MRGLCGSNENQLQRENGENYASTNYVTCDSYLLHSRQLCGENGWLYYTGRSLHKFSCYKSYAFRLHVMIKTKG
jgi:hypothetical protein